MILKTERTISSPLVRDDFDALLEMYSEPDAFKFAQPFQDKTPDFFLDLLNNRLSQNKNSICFWVPKWKETNETLGIINLNFIEAIDGHHIGCHLKREHWNKGLASELLSELMRYGMHEKGLDKIYGLVEKENHASKKMLQKIGLHYDSNREIFNTDIEVCCTSPMA